MLTDSLSADLDDLGSPCSPDDVAGGANQVRQLSGCIRERLAAIGPGSKDRTIKIWHVNMCYALELWCVVLHQETNKVAVWSLAQPGLLIRCTQSTPWQTGARIPLTPHKPGSTEMYANTIVHSNGVHYLVKAEQLLALERDQSFKDSEEWQA